MLTESTGPCQAPSTAWRGGLEVRLRNRVLSVLRDVGHPELWSVQCEVRDSTIVLHGVLPSYYLKQVAQHAVLVLCEQWVVENRIEVSS